MSSIDKYVEGEARKYNPNVQVTNRNGRITARIDGKIVFEIADRYGYLDDEEKSIISRSMYAYDYERIERERRERERLENERVAARESLKREVLDSRRKLTAAYSSSKSAANGVIASADFKSQFKRLEGYNTDRLIKRAEGLKADAQNALSAVEREYSEKLRRIDGVSSQITENAATGAYTSLRSRLNEVSVNLIGVRFPAAQIEEFKRELERITVAMKEVKELESKLSSIHGDTLINNIVADTLREIRSTEISTIADVNSIVDKVNKRLTEIKEIAYRSKTDKDMDAIASIAGALKACTQLREFVFESTYSKKRHGDEIMQVAARVYDEYASLASAQFTTCSDEKLLSVFAIVSEVMAGTKDDEDTLTLLKNLLEECAVYKRDDRLKEDDYRLYSEKIQELLEHGGVVSEELKFDAKNSQAQIKRLNALLLKHEIEAAASKSMTSFILACQTMEKMGYEVLYSASAENGLGFEAVFAKPGHEGVVWQIIASDCNIRRRVLGIKRTDGRCTDEEVVMEEAKEMDDSGEVKEFLQAYSGAGGGRLKSPVHVDTRDANCRDAIRANGYFDLEKEGEEKFDKIVAKAEPKRKTKAAASAYVAEAKSVRTTRGELERMSRDCELKIRAKKR